MDTPGEIAVFVEVAQAGSFAGAAARLGLTPSAVSKIVSRLEERLGARLLNRTTRAQTLTQAGAVYLEHAERILAETGLAEAAVRDHATSPTGSLKVAATDAFAIMVIVPFLKSFLPRYPRLSVTITHGDGEVDLVAEGVDVAIRFARPTNPAFVSRRITDDPYVLCASPGYLERRGVPAAPADLSGHDCLTVHARGRTSRRWTLERGEERAAVRASGPFSGIGLAVREAALSGLGIARLASYLVRPEIEAGLLVPVLPDWDLGRDRAIHAVYPERAFLPPKTRVFVDELAEFTRREAPRREARR